MARQATTAAVPAASTPPSYDGQENDQSSSVEALLSVPLNFIFRESRPPAPVSPPVHVPPPQPPLRRRTLLSRSEASVLLRTSQLAAELDVLQSVASEALDRMRRSRLLRERIERQDPRRNTYLRPLLPLLDVHGVRVPRGAVGHVAAETGRVLSELGGCAAALRQFAEQNWSVAEHLCDAFGYDDSVAVGAAATRNGLGREKRVVAEVEEAVSSRIEGLIGMATVGQGVGTVDETNGAVDAFDLATDAVTGKFLSMQDLCQQLLLGIGCDSNTESEKVIEEAEATATTPLNGIEGGQKTASESENVSIEKNNNEGHDAVGVTTTANRLPQKGTDKLQSNPGEDLGKDKANNGDTQSRNEVPSVPQPAGGTNEEMGGSASVEKNGMAAAEDGTSLSQGVSQSGMASEDGIEGRNTQDAVAALAVLASS